MLKRITIILLSLISLFIFCLKLPTLPGEKEFYFNSFEDSSDIADWKGIQLSQLKNDVPPNGGKKSVQIAGGCVVPHASLELVNNASDGYLKLSCWGKNLMHGGIVLLRTKSDSPQEISINISDSTWTFYESSEKLFCPTNEKLIIEMNSGGILASAMLIDLLKIEKQK